MTGRANASQEALNALLRETLPRQGAWTDAGYLWLTDRSRRLIEFTDGYIEELPAPTSTHQGILAALYELFCRHLRPRGGIVLVSALRLRIREGKFREPDILLLRHRSDPRYQDRYWLGADLVAEVVSPDDTRRDLVDGFRGNAVGRLPDFLSGRQSPVEFLWLIIRWHFRQQGLQVVSAPDWQYRFDDNPPVLHGQAHLVAQMNAGFAE